MRWMTAFFATAGRLDAGERTVVADIFGLLETWLLQI
jgi:hypothetical protein